MALADEEALLEIGERLFGAPSPRGLKARTVAPSVRSSGGVAESRVERSAAVREKLQGLVRGSPEVMVKVSGTSRGFGHLRAHFSYISRDGQIELEDQDGQVVNGGDGLADIRADWQSSYPIPEERRGSNGDGRDVRRREAFHLVMSMPAGTPEIALKRAVRDFAAEEFGGYQYVMALHTPTTDPDPEPSPHPHVHLTIKARSLAGVRLNPRKADLQRWRERFAARLRDQGVEAGATRRQVRLQRDPGRGQKVQQMMARGVQPSRAQRRVDSATAVTRRAETEGRVIGDLSAAARILSESASEADKALARDLLARLDRAGAGHQREASLDKEPLRPKGHDR
jgi:hypothetical protein